MPDALGPPCRSTIVRLITSGDMRALHPVAKFALVAVVVLLGFGTSLIWHFCMAHQLATLDLPGELHARLTINFHYDASHDVLCEVRGPKLQFPAQIIAFIGAGESVPGFTVHQTTNHQVFWITADTLPKTILYAADIGTGEHWPSRESDEGQKFLELANRSESGYRLYQHEWIGVKK